MNIFLRPPWLSKHNIFYFTKQRKGYACEQNIQKKSILLEVHVIEEAKTHLYPQFIPPYPFKTAMAGFQILRPLPPHLMIHLSLQMNRTNMVALAGILIHKKIHTMR